MSKRKRADGGQGGRNWLLVGLLTLLLAFAMGTFGVIWMQRADDTRASDATTRIQIDAQALALYASAATGGNLDAFDEMERTLENLEGYVRILRDEYRQREAVSQPTRTLVSAWSAVSTHGRRIVGSRELVLQTAATVADANSKLRPLLTAVTDIASRNGSASVVASRVAALGERMLRQLGGMVATSDAIPVDNTIADDVRPFGAGLNALLGSDAGSSLVEASQGWAQLAPGLLRAGESGADLAAVRGANSELANAALDLQVRAEVLSKAIADLPTARVWPNAISAAIAAVAALVLLFLMVLKLVRDQQRRYAASTELNHRNQEAILRLLDEMGSLAEGDLTVQATVTEDITGAIADSVNFAIEALRSLVTTINETAVQVSAAAQETQATAVHLADAAEHQARQISSSSAAVTDMAASIDRVSANSAESANVAQRSVVIAAKGAMMVRQTIDGMDSIRDQIQETSKRIKRLGESSQEIGSIVELINDIAEQTNILALNAAIQAASAGETGRGFAVVADEVQHLAERASNATRRIETLVQTIQSDTNEAVSSMEQTTAEVVAGARLAEDAGQALGEIEKVSTDLASLIQRISAAARQQSSAATSISATMNAIREITKQTSVGASQTAESIGNLAQLAADLRRSVADFKLPA